MTIEELKQHCEREIEMCKHFANKDNTSIENSKIYQEHRLVLDLIEGQTIDENQMDLSSHSEKEIVKCCISLMNELVDEFEEWYKWQHGEDAIDLLDDEEKFCYRKSYFSIVQELLLLHTNHCGGGSTRAKCGDLGFDYGEEIEFGFEQNEN